MPRLDAPRPLRREDASRHLWKTSKFEQKLVYAAALHACCPHRAHDLLHTALHHHAPETLPVAAVASVTVYVFFAANAVAFEQAAQVTRNETQSRFGAPLNVCTASVHNFGITCRGAFGFAAPTREHVAKTVALLEVIHGSRCAACLQAVGQVCTPLQKAARTLLCACV